MTHYEDHWYTDDPVGGDAGKAYAALTVSACSDAANVYDLDAHHVDVKDATIIRNNPSEDYLSLTVTPKAAPKSPFTVEYWADIDYRHEPIQSMLITGGVSRDLFLGTRVWHPNANAAVKGRTDMGGMAKLGPYVYLQSELYDPSLLP